MNEELKQKIDSMTHEEMARAWRFTPAGDPLFQGEAGEYFTKRFNELGGMTIAVSKKIGL